MLNRAPLATYFVSRLLQMSVTGLCETGDQGRYGTFTVAKMFGVTCGLLCEVRCVIT